MPPTEERDGWVKEKTTVGVTKNQCSGGRKEADGGFCPVSPTPTPSQVLREAGEYARGITAMNITTKVCKAEVGSSLLR